MMSGGLRESGHNSVKQALEVDFLLMICNKFMGFSGDF